MSLKCVTALLLSLFFAACTRVDTGPPIIPQSEPFKASDRIVGTYYFYWYKYPTEHFFDNGAYTDDALTDHFVDPESVDYESVDWHVKELTDIAWCGIDFILPVYWGAPGAEETRHGRFSTLGLAAMQKARDRMLAAEKPCPRIGMFYDTSTLLNNMRGDTPRGGKADLTTQHGKDVLYVTIRDYWRQLDPKHWATIDGHPLTVLYGSAFASGFDQSTFDYVYEQFEKDFNVRPLIYGDGSWRAAKLDGYYRWGAALAGPRIDDIAEIGPGYDDRAVPGRSTPIREREDGRFYEHSWLEAIRSGCRIVLIETWNEMHEGTDICESLEYGRRYMYLTRNYISLFKKSIDLKYRSPRPRGPTDEGSEYAARRIVSIDFNDGGSDGLRAISAGDGLFRNVEAAGRKCVQTEPGKTTYLYIRVPDPFFFDLHEPVEITLDYLDSGEGGILLQYDSHNEDAPFAGAYTDGDVIARKGTGEWRTYTFKLEDTAFMSRQNHRCDFRFAVLGEPINVSRVEVRKVK